MGFTTSEGDAAGAWATPCEILSAKYGGHARENLEHRTRVEASDVGSPISAEDLLSSGPEQATSMISSWRPKPTDWLAEARKLARTLESVVKDDAEAWTATPIHFAMRLHHPTYINHYLRALASLAADHELPVDELVDLVKLVKTHPWEVVVLGGDNFAYDVDWRGAEESGVELLLALANSKDSFGNRANEVWTILEAEVMNCAESSTAIW